MKKFWKVLGITAAIAAIAPYRVSTDEETGEKKVEALLWRATAAPKDGEEKMSMDVRFGFQSPFAAKSEEPLFDEEPVAEFTSAEMDETAAEEGEATAEEGEAAQAADEAAAEAETAAAQDEEEKADL